MRYRLRALSVLLLALLLLGGCARLLPEVDPEPGEEASAGPGEITLSSQSTEELFFLPYAPQLGVNPYTCQSRTNLTFLPLVYEGLFTVTPNYAAQGVLCESWEVSDDGKLYTLTLREDVRFHSGIVLTTQDVLYSIDYARSSQTYGTRLSCIQSVDAEDDRILIRLYQPRDQFLLLLDFPIVRSGTGDLEQPDGTGPYLLVLTGDNDNYLDSRNDWWGGTDLPISRIYLLLCPTAVDVRDSFELGRISLACTDINSAAAVPYHSDCEQWRQSGPDLLYLGFNRANGLFAAKALRQAVTYAIDREAISGAGGGYIAPAYLPASPDSPVYNGALATHFASNTDQARLYLQDAGLRDLDQDGILDQETELGVEPASATLIVSSGSLADVSAAQSIAESLRDLGLDITVETLDPEAYESRRRNGQYDLFYESLRMTPDFDLTYLLRDLGLLDTYTNTLCSMALENMGNFYDLHEYLMQEGAFCPVGFKSSAVYVLRGHASGLDPAPYNVFYGLSNLTLMSGGIQ